ncbi:MAG: hypothetical protein AAFV88_02390, partial [Planctomycetota bacterium]
MKSLKAPVVFLIVCLCIAASANAHYLWVSVDRAPEMRGTNIYFEETPKAGDGHYLDHFLGKSDVWIRTVERPAPKPIKAEEVKAREKRWMRVALPEADAYSVDSYGKFGVYAYGEKKVLLHYYARNLNVDSHDAMHELGRAEQMDLDLVPHDHGGQIEFTLLWKGEPVADRMVFIRGPEGFRENVKTNAKGRIELKRLSKGTLTLRSSVEFDTPGNENGEAFEAIRHNVTLVMPMNHASKAVNVEAKNLDVTNDAPLKVNESRSSELTLKTADEYTVNVKENTFVLGTVDQISVDVAVSIHDMDGKKLAEFDGSGRGPEYFHFESDKAGLYKIQLPAAHVVCGSSLLTCIKCMFPFVDGILITAPSG